MDGYEFEYQCAKILKRKHFSKIKVTQSSSLHRNWMLNYGPTALLHLFTVYRLRS